jgi:hypothetical protein
MHHSFVVTALLAFAALSGCGSTYEVPPPPDARISLDLAVSPPVVLPDMACLNMACGGCSQWLSWNGMPSKVGDPCLWKGAYACTGTQLTCTSNACLACTDTTKHAAGTVCGAAGHTIVELNYVGTTCTAYDFGSAIGVCNRTRDDHCVQRCRGPNGNTYDCVAGCTSDDGGGTGCAHGANDTCESLTSC